MDEDELVDVDSARLPRRNGTEKYRTQECEMTQPIHHQCHQDSRPIAAKKGGRGHSLADEQDIYGAQVEVVKERQASQSIVSRVLAGIELEGRLAMVATIRKRSRHHIP